MVASRARWARTRPGESARTCSRMRSGPAGLEDSVDLAQGAAWSGTVHSTRATEPGNGDVVTVEVDHDAACWTPDTAVVYAGATVAACCPSADRSCRYINFFTTSHAASVWADRHPDVSGGVLDQRAALAAGVAEFGSL